jgi:6-phosphogluconolactonase
MIRPMTVAVFGAVLMVSAISAREVRARAPRKVRVYVGTYTSGESKGIYRLLLDQTTGELVGDGEPTPAVNPSFLAIHPGGRFLYAVNETGDARTDPSGAVSAYAIGKDGVLTLLNQQPSGGPAPCHLTTDDAGRHLLVANYWGGSVSVLPVLEDGRLGAATALARHQGRGPHPRQEAPHAHSVHVDATGRRAFVADLGLDRLVAYAYDGARGTLAREEKADARLAPGSGPRHFAFARGGALAYVLNELDATVAVLAYDAAAGTFRDLQAVGTLPAGFKGENTTAEVVVSPDGRFLYASNRGHDSIALFAIGASDGRLTPSGHVSTLGRRPRNFAIDPSGRFLLAANQDSDSIVVFAVDASTGQLTPVGAPVRVPRPVCVRFQSVD